MCLFIYNKFLKQWHIVFNKRKIMTSLSPLDPTSFSRTELAITKHITWRMLVDFNEQVLKAEVTLHIEVLNTMQDLILDTYKLKIESIETKEGCLEYRMDEPVLNFGSKLTVMLPNKALSGDKLEIKIKYTTDPSAPALTWLQPHQTLGKTYPYLYSQASPIHARSMLPCQDSPAVKFTYDAEVRVPDRFTVRMSALTREVRACCYYQQVIFTQPVAIPSYLLALAVGVLDCRILGPRSRIWSEKENIEGCALEFSDVEKYLQAAEKVLGPYDWKEYDILVLPPSFPHAGMENPCLTFLSPTVIAGDKSLADVVIHEIVHSWIGNIVCIKNFEHFWLKEGFTVFLQRKISASLIDDATKAKQSRDFQSLLGLQLLTEGINRLGEQHPLTKLVLNLDGIHPADAFSIVPYEKGALFFCYLENLVGEAFDQFPCFFVKQFSNQSIDTDQFKMFFLYYFKNFDSITNIDWASWLYKSGMPPVIPDYDKTMMNEVTVLAKRIERPNYAFPPKDIKKLNVHQVIDLLQKLIERPPMSIEQLRKLNTAYNLDDTKNDEILYRWLRLCMRSKDESKLDEVFLFLNGMGRLKFVRPLYRELYAWDEVRDRAICNFKKNEECMSHLTSYNLRKDLHLTPKSL